MAGRGPIDSESLYRVIEIGISWDSEPGMVSSECVMAGSLEVISIGIDSGAAIPARIVARLAGFKVGKPGNIME